MKTKTRIYIFLFTIQTVTATIAANIWSSTHIDNNEGMSNSSVNVIFQDHDNILWIGTWDGLNRYDGNHITQYHSISRDTTTLSNSIVRDIVEEDSVYLWVVTDMGINRFDRKAGTFKRFYLDKGNSKGNYAENSYHCTSNGKGMVIACRNKGRIMAFNNETLSFQQMHLSKVPQERIKEIHFSDPNHLVVVTANTLLEYVLSDKLNLHLTSALRMQQGFNTPIFDNNGNGYIQIGEEVCRLVKGLRIEHTGILIKNKITAASTIGDNTALATTNGLYLADKQKVVGHILEGTTVTSLLHGTQGILWAGTDGKGMFQFYNKPKSIVTYNIGKHESAVRAILRSGNNIFVGTKGEGLFVYETDRKDSLHLIHNINVGPGRTHNAVFALCPSKDKTRIWVGTDGEGLSYYEDGMLHKMNFANHQHAKTINSIYSIAQYDDSTIFAGTSGHGVVRVRFKQNTITNVLPISRILPKDVDADIVYSQALDGNHLWFGARGEGLFKLDIRNMHCEHFVNDGTDNKNQLISNDVISLHKSSNGNLWVGTSQGLCVLKEQGKKSSFKWITTGAADDILNVHSIQESATNNIWVSTSNGVYIILKNESCIRLTYRDGLQGNEFADGAGCAFNNGQAIYFGGTKGMNAIFTYQIRNDGYMPTLILESVAIDGKKIPLNKDINLGTKSRSVQFSFSIPDYINNDRCQLSYSLIRKSLFSNSRHPNWLLGNPGKVVTLNELPPGHYVLMVRQSNFSQQWASHYLEIPFHVDYPLWQRWWAVIAYIIILSGLIRVVYLRKKQKLIKRHKRDMEKQGERAREEIHHAKLRFFASVTRAFSSNITQIFDAVNSIRKNQDDDIENNLAIIDKNVKMMSTNIRQISEIRSTEENLPLTPAKFNLYDLIITSIENYVDKILKSDIKTGTDKKKLDVDIITDRPVFSKALSYLLEYIFQNINDGSTLAFNYNIYGLTVQLNITYQGHYPNNEEMTEIYNTYKAVDQFENDQTRVGRIIGVTICNSLLKRLGGKLSITKTKDRVDFQLSIEQMSLPKAALPQKEDTVIDKIIQNKDKRVWLIGCHPTMVEFIQRILGGQYNIVSTSIKDMEKDPPKEVDLIICGLTEHNYDFIKRLRADQHTKYIPILAICDEGSKDTYADVLATGVNSLLERPFTAKYFKTIVDHTFLDTQRMRDFSTSSSAYTQRFDALGMSKKDKEFMYQAVETLRQHFSDDSYTPDRLAKDMVISRSQLYRRMREATNASPGDFILEYRLVHAELLLKTTEMTVSEIINACGFHNRSYFYREFARRNNCLPIEFRKNPQEQKI